MAGFAESDSTDGAVNHDEVIYRIGFKTMIFADSSAWIALSNPRDRHYDEAITAFNRLLQRRLQIVTTDYVIDETVTRLRHDLSHAAAVNSSMSLIALHKKIRCP